MSATHRRHPRTPAPRSDQETCACRPSEPTPPPRSLRLTLSVGHLDTRQQPHGTRNHNTSARPHRPPYDSTPILIDRVRRNRQRLRSNGSIESDSAVHHPLSADTPARRVTPDRVITFIVTEAFPFQPRCGDWSFGSKKGSSRLRLNDTPWSRQDSSGLSSTAILSSNCRLRGRGKSKEFGPLAIEITRELHDLA
jgi:hypothetical protein